MPAPVIPTKTDLGHEEQRHRAGGLGQRHRTILFLIDGRRPLSEVLSLAQQAGASTTHFEDLVRLGYVQMPPEEAPPPAVPVAAPLAEAAAVVDVAELTHVELTVPAVEPPGAPVVVPAPVAQTLIVAGDLAPVAEPDVPVLPVLAMPVESSIVAPVATPGAAQEPELPPELPPAPPLVRPARSPVAQAVAALVADEDAEPLAVVRRCLTDTLRLDLTPFSFRAQSRVRDAKDAAALIELIWEIEADLPHSRRSRAGLLSLQRARELLGLGNTLVDEDSQAGKLDDDW